MSYQALYRKYRPTNIDDVVGQEFIVKIIKNSLKNNMINHAYMFSGPRGTGKTTIAKILAKTINCMVPDNGIPCGKCKNCISINNYGCTDIIEIDAASNNGVDEIREIRNNVSLVPSELKYKVYIIDEVHMLSIGAFNALLKTLEEPPEHVIFILATTDLHKVPVTIVSRCQCYDFHRLSENEIISRLKYIVDQEKIDVDEEVLKSIAFLSDGGLRDAIGMLDKVYSYSESKITVEDFEKINGIVSYDSKIKFINFLYNNDIKNVIGFIDDIYNNGKDLIIFYNDLLQLFRNFIVKYYMNESIEYDIDFLLKFLNVFSNRMLEMKKSNNTKILFEICIFEFVNLYFHKTVDKNISISPVVEKNTNSLEKIMVEESNDNLISNNTSVEDDYIKILDLIINNCFSKANKKILSDLKSDWGKINDYSLDDNFGSLCSYIIDAQLRAASDNEMILTFDYDSMVNRGYANIIEIENMFDKIFSHRYRIAIISSDEWEKRKKEYIEKKNKGESYEYTEIPLITGNNISNNDIINKDKKITNKAVELFGSDLVD